MPCYRNTTSHCSNRLTLSKVVYWFWRLQHNKLFIPFVNPFCVTNFYVGIFAHYFQQILFIFQSQFYTMGILFRFRQTGKTQVGGKLGKKSRFEMSFNNWMESFLFGPFCKDLLAFKGLSVRKVAWETHFWKIVMLVTNKKQGLVILTSFQIF